MSFQCCVCSIRGNFKKYYSKFIGSIDNEALYYCDGCYDKKEESEEFLIKFAIKNGDNISNIVKQEKLIDYVNPTSTTILIKPMNIYKIVNEIVDGIKKEFVMISIEEYNNYMIHIACSNKKLIDDEKLKLKREQQHKQEAVERRKIESINYKEKKDIDKEKQLEQKIKDEIKINKFNNDRIKKEKEELLEKYKEVIDNNPQSVIKKCDFCKSYKILPYHFRDENNKPFLRAYTQDKKQVKNICCIDCYEEVLIKKEEKKLNNSHKCEICDKIIITYTDELYVKHLNSTQHKKNEALLKGKKDLSLLNVKELNKICSKTIDEKGLYRINNYSKVKKIELLEKMNAIYDLLIFD